MIPLRSSFHSIHWVAATFIIAIAVGGCGKEPPAPVADPAAPEAAAPMNEGAPRWVHIRAVDENGAPIPGLTPIATRMANAFDAPAAYGQPTDETGHSALQVPESMRAYIRAWDPTLERFANNFFEVPAGSGAVDNVMEVQMLPSSAITAVLHTADGRPVVTEEVTITLAHATRGPWWPGEGTTNAEGAVRVDHIPAGKYLLQIRCASGVLEIPETALIPGRATELGVLQVVPSES